MPAQPVVPAYLVTPEDSCAISLPVGGEANALLSRNALALLLAMLLDQQVSRELAFSAPRDLARRLGHEPIAEELELGPGGLAAVFHGRSTGLDAAR